MITILDCYTDEPSGLGVPPYLGVYPRYIAGHLDKLPTYITIDDLRLFQKYQSKIPKEKYKTNIRIYNLTKNYPNIERILRKTTSLIIILGSHTPGKYLSAVPGTLKEILPTLKKLKCEKIITGPASYDLKPFDDLQINHFNFSYKEIKNYAVKGALITKQIPDTRIIEIETSKGCPRTSHCLFCKEGLKQLETRELKDILKEVKEFYSLGCRHFRIGKQSCFYSYPHASELLKELSKLKLETLHIDNANPEKIITPEGIELTKDIVEYCTEGNIAALGVESFDEKVIKDNCLNSSPETTLKAIEIINKYGSERGLNGMPKFLPGINIILGLKSETKETLDINYEFLKKILDKKLLIRRINIRQLVKYPNTEILKEKLPRNKKHYYKFREKIRTEIDYEMLKLVTPKGLILKDVRTEIHDGNTTFARQLGTYPLIVGIKEKLPLKKFYDVKITNHMLRSITGEVFLSK